MVPTQKPEIQYVISRKAFLRLPCGSGGDRDPVLCIVEKLERDVKERGLERSGEENSYSFIDL